MQTLRLDVINNRTTKLHPSGNKITGLQTFHVPGICHLELCSKMIQMQPSLLRIHCHAKESSMHNCTCTSRLRTNSIRTKGRSSNKVVIRTQFSLRKVKTRFKCLIKNQYFFLYLTFTIFSHYPKDVTKKISKTFRHVLFFFFFIIFFCSEYFFTTEVF